MADSKARGHTALQIVVAVLAVLAVVALLAWARGEPGIDGRAPDPEDATAIEQNYAARDPAVVREEVLASAARLADRFDSVQGEQWERQGTRSDGVTFTIRSFAVYLVHDPIHHLWDVQA